ncbi:hypothetical protein EJV46_17645 [Roseococcus sp. SYP-B2431]|uniref:hypothetical protein n=1 Tax=Roseococcus sp. SYP-B2431 TaxID=2496640 RepID=UPI00103FEDC6|nr:hypothetical protein [Roseococcus sp. SYP-B2431]TCH97140.1 hypothetical protein EJV46_17645 [Roseococcus sp. SYP-B2431]
MSGRRVTFVARAPRSAFGRFCKWLFIGFNLLMLVLSLANCAVVIPYVASEDPDVAAGAGLFGALLAFGIWTVWPLGALILGILTLVTRGRRLTLEQELPP